MKLLISFGFGVGFRGNGDAILFHERYDGLKQICDRATELFGGFTKFVTVGGWRDPDTKRVVTEEGCTISVLVDDSKVRWTLEVDENVADMVQQIKDSMQQKAVAVTRTEVQFDIL